MKKKYCFILDTGSSYQLINNSEYPDTYVISIEVSRTKKNGDMHQYKDEQNFNLDDLRVYLQQKDDLNTSQPNIYLVEELIQKLQNEYEKIIFLPLSKDLSGFYLTLKSLESKYKELIVVDTGCVGIWGNWIREDLIEVLEKDKIDLTSKAINDFVKNRNKKRCGALIVADLSQLIKSGRVNKAKGTLAKIFNLKILIKFDSSLEYESKDLSIGASLKKALKMIDDKVNYTKNGIKRITLMPELDDNSLNEKLVLMTQKSLNIREYVDSKLPNCVKLHTGLDIFSIIIEAK